MLAPGAGSQPGPSGSARDPHSEGFLHLSLGQQGAASGSCCGGRPTLEGKSKFSERKGSTHDYYTKKPSLDTSLLCSTELSGHFHMI